jgi:peptidoglycan/LPS O-acetylase OafA/YrhL
MPTASPVRSAAPVVQTSRARIDVFDGLRGIAIVLVVLSHGWAIWPTTRINDNAFVQTLFSSGNYAVSIFFVIGFFLATGSMLRRVGTPAGLHPGVFLLRRFIRLSGEVYFLLLALVVMTALDTTDSYPDTETRTSVLRIGTYTWNWYLQQHALVARPDVGHLWYLSVDLQVFTLVLGVVYLLRRRPAWLLVALGALLLACLSWRAHVYEAEGVYQALLRTTVRMDAPLVGALAAAAVPFVGRWRRHAPAMTGVGLFALVPLLHFNVSSSGYFGLPGLLLDLALAAVVIGVSLAEPGRRVRGVLGRRTIVYLGQRSLSLYLWHYPIFWFVSRHSADWRWEGRTALALALTLVAAHLSYRLVGQRVQRTLDSPAWHEMDRGLPSYLAARARTGLAARRAARGERNTTAA